VNAYVATVAQLPLEYGAVEITRFQPWTALDTVTVAKAITFELSFALDDIANTVALQTYSAVFGPATGLTLFSEDVWRSQPFYLASTVPDASVGAVTPLRATPPGHANRVDESAAALGRGYLDRVRDIPFFKERLSRDDRPGSNEWAVSGRLTVNGLPLVANDPHLFQTAPSTFYPIHLTAAIRM
jgi:penicillin amidase